MYLFYVEIHSLDNGPHIFKRPKVCHLGSLTGSTLDWKLSSTASNASGHQCMRALSSCQIAILLVYMLPNSWFTFSWTMSAYMIPLIVFCNGVDTPSTDHSQRLRILMKPIPWLHSGAPPQDISPAEYFSSEPLQAYLQLHPDFLTKQHYSLNVLFDDI